MVLWVVCRWGHMVALSVPSEVEQHASINGKFARNEPPDTAVAAVAVQAEERERARDSRTCRRPDHLVGQSRASVTNSKGAYWTLVDHG
jgi:hypothetical protein